MSDAAAILVTGATGRQGGATARHLLAKGHRVRVMTRRPQGAAVQALVALGAEAVRGDFDDPQSLRDAVHGCAGVFSVQNFWEKGVGYEGEVRQGKALVDAAKEAGVGHFVQTSIAGCDRAPSVQHFRSKWEIEQHIRAQGLPATMLRTVFFMDNWLDAKAGKMTFPLLSGGLRKDLRFHMVATDDIGAVAARVFAERDRFVGKSVDLAGDALTVPEMKEIYRRVTGRAAPWFKIPGWLISLMSGEMGHQLEWNNAGGWTFSIDEVRALHPSMTAYEQFVQKHFR